MVTITEFNSITNEINQMMTYLNCSKQDLEKMIDKTCDTYPQVASRKDSIYMIAQEKRLQFTYNKKGLVSGLVEIADDDDLDMSQYLE